MRGYEGSIQKKNLAWYLPRPAKDKYKGGMPRFCEEWLIELAKDILQRKTIKILNVFCGMNQLGTRVDINPAVHPDYVCDAHHLTEMIHDQFDIILIII